MWRGNEKIVSGMKKIFCGNEMDRMPDWAFRSMAFMFNVADLFKSPDSKLKPFNIQKGQTVIDYGCGTGRFLPGTSALVGEKGLVYAVDIHELAIKCAFMQIEKYKLQNVKPVLTDGKTVDISSQSADIIYALDMFHMVKDTDSFLQELNRMIKRDGTLFLEDGHQLRALTLEKIQKSACWVVAEESKSFVRCKPGL
jgi:ubiquinone/menaquinone biosynthesis C-methylase UbiE